MSCVTTDTSVFNIGVYCVAQYQMLSRIPLLSYQSAILSFHTYHGAPVCAKLYPFPLKYVMIIGLFGGNGSVYDGCSFDAVKHYVHGQNNDRFALLLFFVDL